MELEAAHDVAQLRVRSRIEFLERIEGQRVSDAGDDILALSIGEVVAVDAAGTGAGVAGEGDAGARSGAGVSERHDLDVHGRTEVMRDALAAAVELRPVGVPGLEHGEHREVELLVGILRELLAGLGEDDCLVVVDECLERCDRKVDIGRDSRLLLRTIECSLEALAMEAEYRLAEHLDEPPVRIPGEVLVAGLLGQPAHALVVEPDVEDGVHHPGHRVLAARPDRHEHRIMRVAEPLVDLALQPPDMEFELAPQALGSLAVLEVVAARLCRDGESRRHRQAQSRHLREVGPLAAEQVLLGPIALGEGEDVLDRMRRACHLGM